MKQEENHPSSDSFCLSWLFSTFNELKGISNYLSSYYQTFHLKKHMHENRKVYSILLYFAKMKSGIQKISFTQLCFNSCTSRGAKIFQTALSFFQDNFGLFSIVKKYEYDNRVFQNHVLKIRNYRNQLKIWNSSFRQPSQLIIFPFC